MRWQSFWMRLKEKKGNCNCIKTRSFEWKWGHLHTDGVNVMEWYTTGEVLFWLLRPTPCVARLLRWFSRAASSPMVRSSGSSSLSSSWWWFMQPAGCSHSINKSLHPRALHIVTTDGSGGIPDRVGTATVTTTNNSTSVHCLLSGVAVVYGFIALKWKCIMCNKWEHASRFSLLFTTCTLFQWRI